MMIMEYNSFHYRGRWPTSFGLKEGCAALRDYAYRPAHESSDDFYLVTHILYVLSCYSSIRLRENMAPGLFRYVRRSLRAWLEVARKDTGDIRKNHAIDLDGVAECLDLLRGAGFTEITDPDLCEGTLLLLAAQNKNG